MNPDDKTSNFDLELPEAFRTRFQILFCIGAGGTGTVYKGWDHTLKRALALKVLNRDQISEANILRLHREAKTICQLKHSNIVGIYDFLVTDKNEPVMVMEFVDGTSLDDLVEKNGPFHLQDGLNIFLQICRAMDFAHERQILHRDLTPNNILIRTTSSGSYEVKVVDFGIARVGGMQEKTISQSGGFMGSSTVASPEQVKGEPTDARSDIYSLGCTMFKAFTGRYPHIADSFLETVQKQINESSPSMTAVNPEGNYPAALEEVIARTLEKDPQDRFQSMKDLLYSVEKLARGELGSETSTFALDARPRASRLRRSAPYLVAFVAVFVAIVWGYLVVDRLISENSEPDFNDIKLSTRNDQKWLEAQTKFSHAILWKLKHNPEIKRVALSGIQVSDEQLQSVCAFRPVIIDLRRSNITDDSLQIVARCPSLRSVILNGCKITDAGLKHLFVLKKLKVIALDGTGVTDRGVGELIAHNPTLRLLHLANCRNVTDKSIDGFLLLPNLDSLRLDGTHVTPDGVTRIMRETKTLGYLNVAGLDLEDKNIPDHISAGLTRLDLHDNKLTKNILAKAERLQGLYFLDLKGCPIDTETLIAFRDRIWQKNKIVIVPVSALYQSEKDTESFFEPTLYELSNGDQEIMHKLETKWYADGVMGSLGGL